MTTNDLFSIVGKTALVTGGTRGIGKMIAEGLVEAGAVVYISSRKADACADVAAELSAKGPCTGLPANLSTEAGCSALAEEMASRLDRLDILVNNAGATLGAPLAEFDEAAFEKVLALNVKGVFHLKFLVPLLQSAGTAEEPARVINIGSVEGFSVPVLENYSYSASKAAVHHLTRHLAKRLAPVITVNAIAPGPFESKMMAATLEAFGEHIVANAPLKRIGRPDNIAGATIFLSSRAGAYVTVRYPRRRRYRHHALNAARARPEPVRPSVARGSAAPWTGTRPRRVWLRPKWSAARSTRRSRRPTAAP